MTAIDAQSPASQVLDLNDPRLFEGVLSRRAGAFFVDATIIMVLWTVAAMVLFVLGVLTFGLLFPLYAILFPTIGLGYSAFTVGGPRSATPGMRLMDVEMRLTDGSRPDPLHAAVHALLFWASVSLLTPFVLVLGLLTPGKRLLQDLLTGLVAIRRPR